MNVVYKYNIFPSW